VKRPAIVGPAAHNGMVRKAPQDVTTPGDLAACAVMAALLGAAAAVAWKAGLAVITTSCLGVAGMLLAVAALLALAPRLTALRERRAHPAPPPALDSPAERRGEEQSRAANPFNQVA
jgi:hypothetical protein